MSVPEPADTDAVLRSPPPDDGVSVDEWRKVITRVRLSPEVKNVAEMLARHADYATGENAYPGVARLAVEANTSISAVSRALRRLRNSGLIEVTARGNRRRGLADTYRLTVTVEASAALPTDDDIRRMVGELAEANRAESGKRAARAKARKASTVTSDRKSEVSTVTPDRPSTVTSDRAPPLGPPLLQQPPLSTGLGDHPSPNRHVRVRARDVARLLDDTFRMPE